MSDHKPTRLEQMDYLRGLAALGIMCYHYGWWWLDIHFDSSEFLGLIGIYGVSIFYVLSGFTLQWVYGSRIVDHSDWKQFFRKRFFRIYPLFLAATILTLLISKNWPDWRTVLYNVTGVFGFVAWDRSIAAGGWSIGNELVFYILFPLMIIRNAGVNKLTSLLYLVTTLVFVCFAWSIIHDNVPIVDQWRGYSHPLNQLWFFFSGVLLCHFLSKYTVSPRWGYAIIAAAFLVLVFYPAQGDQSVIISGWNRMALSMVVLILVMAFYWIRPFTNQILHRALSWLGACSYSIYLLHPIVYKIIKVGNERVMSHWVHVPNWFWMGISFGVTFIVSHWVYHKVERYFMRKA